MTKIARAVCKNCLRTFLTVMPEEDEFCWECGQGLIYICGEEIIGKEETKEEKMGTDINFYIEQKDKEGNWKEVDLPEKLLPYERDQYIFGVFGQGQYASDEDLLVSNLENRGFPTDTLFKIDKENAIFGKTYAYLDELMNIKWNYYDETEDSDDHPLRNSYFRAFVQYIIPRYLDLSNDLEYRNVRLIVYFDC